MASSLGQTSAPIRVPTLTDSGSEEEDTAAHTLPLSMGAPPSGSPGQLRARGQSLSTARTSLDQAHPATKATGLATAGSKSASTNVAPVKVVVVVEDKRFSLNVSGSKTIDDLARAIENEYTKLYPTDAAFECCLILDGDLTPLPFDDVLSESLVSGSVVHAVSTEETQADVQLAMNGLARFQSTTLPATVTELEPSGMEMTSPSEATATPAEKGSALDAEFRLILRNQIGLHYFKEFCVKEFSVENLLFWLDVETYRLCEVDDQMRLQLARRIYINYVALEAPLQVNLGQDTRQKIEWPQLGVSPNAFDDAQFHVYAMMKRHSFRRFLTSRNYKELEQQIATDPAAFTAAQGSKVTDVFPANVSKEGAIMETIVHPVGQYKRDFTLIKSMARYWQDTPQTHQKYFEDKNKLTALQKQQRIRREKKLNKFFGEKVDSEHVMIPQSRNGDTGQVSSECDDSTGQLSFAALVPSKEETNASRIRRAGKLSYFFGDEVPTKELKDQIARSRSADEVGSLPETPVSSPLSPSDQRISQELSVEEKRNLTRRSRKLQEYFGESINELQNTSSTRITAKPTSTFARSKTFFESLFSMSSSSSNNTNDGSSRPKSTISSLMARRTSADACLGRSASPPCSPAVLMENSMDLDKPEASSHKNDRNDSLSSINLPMDAEAIKKTKEYRRRKLLKLQQFLGERLSATMVTPDTINATSSATDMAPSTKIGSKKYAKALLSANEKKMRQKKMYKLGKVFGELPPVELIIQPSDPWKVRQRKSIQALNLLIDQSNHNDTNLVELVLMLREFEEWEKGENDTSDANSQKPASSSEKRQMQRTLNQRKVNKITRFFGDTPDQRILMAQQVLLDLTESIAEEAREDEELEELQQDIEELKQKIQRRLSVEKGQPKKEITVTACDKSSSSAALPPTHSEPSSDSNVSGPSFYVVHGTEFTLPPRPGADDDDDRADDDDEDDDEDEDEDEDIDEANDIIPSSATSY